MKAKARRERRIAKIVEMQRSMDRAMMEELNGAKRLDQAA